ncbi:MAG TPA: type II and III secretion system protein family protein [Candidatus Angelobacter sp.]|nr:type II and III secretion system protein family protein [Candidatus Angelobacter sp.]
MKVRKSVYVLSLLMIFALAQFANAQQAAPASGSNETQGTQPAQSLGQETASVPLRVMVNKSLLINTTDRLKRVSITDPAVADAVVVTPNQLMIHGRAPGEVTLVVWDDQERSRSFDLRVDVDVTAAAQEIKQLLPDQNINVSASRNALVLSGNVTDKDAAEHAGAIASAYSKNVVNVLTYGPLGAQEVLLEVHFAEVDRTAIMQLGANIFSTGAANTPGSTTTGQFGSVGNPLEVANSIGGSLKGFTTDFKNIDPLNLFLFRPDLNLGVTLKLLQQKNILQILAEPNLIAVNGKEASFLAGGEFPVPVPQSGAVAGAITIQYKEFGVRLNFVPLIMPNGNIHLMVKPEVSSLDFTNGIVLSGFRVPALTTRRAATELELQDGQSFIIAGLLDNRLTNNFSKMPGIGDVPILGLLFRSKDVNKIKSELMVMVTAHKVSPASQKPELPKMPKPFLDEKKFDSSRPGGF